MSEPNAAAATEAPITRHASWLELFFDLVVVAAVALVAHRLHEPSPSGVTSAPPKPPGSTMSG